MEGRRQQRLTAFFPTRQKRVPDEDDDEDNPPRPSKVRAKTSSHSNDDDEEEEEARVQPENDQQLPMRRQPRRLAKEGPRALTAVSNTAAVTAVSVANVAMAAQTFAKDGSEEEDEERSAWWWVQQRELGLARRLTALVASQYKDVYEETVEPRIGAPYFIRAAHGLLLFGGKNGSVGVARAESGAVVGAAAEVFSRWTSEGVALSHDRAVCSSDDGTIGLWRVSEDGLRATATMELGAGVYSCDGVCSSATVLGATKAGTVVSLDAANMQVLRVHNAHKGVAKSVRWCDASVGSFVSCGNDKAVRVWDARARSDDKPALELCSHKNVLNHVDVRGNRVLCCDRSGIVKILDRRMSGTLSEVELGFRESVMCRPVWRDDKTFVACSGSYVLVCSDRRVEQKHDTGCKVVHVTVDAKDPSRVYGVTNYDTCCWSL